MESVTQDMVDSFFDLTKFDVGKYIDDFVFFTQSQYPSILEYYDSQDYTWPAEEMKACKELLKRAHKAEELLTIHSESLDAYKFWILSEHLDDMRWLLETANKSEMWSRSIPTFKKTAVSSYMMRQGQLLERVNTDVAFSSDPDNWVNIGMDNKLMETDYSIEGGVLIKLRFNSNGVTKIFSVLDGLDIPEKIYGKDIDANIKFVETTTLQNPDLPESVTNRRITVNDLAVLGYEDTLLQTIQILTNLKNGDDPSFPDRGMRLQVGSSLASIFYPAIFRELSGNFATDDSFNSVSVINIKTETDAVFIEFEVETRIGTIRNNLIPV